MPNSNVSFLRSSIRWSLWLDQAAVAANAIETLAVSNLPAAILVLFSMIASWSAFVRWERKHHECRASSTGCEGKSPAENPHAKSDCELNWIKQILMNIDSRDAYWGESSHLKNTRTVNACCCLIYSIVFEGRISQRVTLVKSSRRLTNNLPRQAMIANKVPDHHSQEWWINLMWINSC